MAVPAENSLKSVAKAGSQWQRPSFDTALTEFILQHFGTLLANSERVACQPDLASGFDANAVTEYFGGLGHNHALSLSTTFGFNLHEPQVSAGIANFCDAAYQPELKTERCRATVKALLASEPDKSDYLESLESACSFEVVAEQRIDKGSMRMDLLFVWFDADRRPFRLVVEMKFGHVLTAGQLEKYGRDALNKVRHPSHLRLVLLSMDGAFEQADQRSLKEIWRPISWLNFLRRWDARLSDDADTTFRIFRRQVWARIGV